MNVTFPRFLLSLIALTLSLLAWMESVCGQSPLTEAPSATPTESLSPMPTQAPSTTAQQLLDAASRRLQRYKGLESKIRVRTDLMGQPLVGTGSYAQLESSSGLLLRLDLAIQTGQQMTSLKQVSDGHTLWEHWRIGGSERVHWIDLARVARSIKQNPAGLRLSSSNLANGGLPKLLSQLALHFDFNLQPVRSGNLGGLPMWSIAGTWKPEKLAAAAPQAVQGDKIVLDRLPMHLPHQVELVLGRDDLFPYRVTYQRWSTQEPAELLPVVTTEFFEVAIERGTLDPTQFHYELPADMHSEDQTEVYLSALGITPSAGQPISR